MAYETEVARGIALLDEQIPGWRDRVDVDLLDIGYGTPGPCGEGCVLTQVYGRYLDGLEALDLSSGYRYGFIPFSLGDDDGWDGLTTAWRRALGGDAS